MPRSRLAPRLALSAVAVISTLAVLAVADRVVGLALGARPRIEIGFPPGATADFATSEFAFELHTNQVAIRDDEVAIPRGERPRLRVVALGDSFTFGWGVELDESWPEVVETTLRARGLDVEVVNLGRPGAGPVDYADFAEGALPMLDPDLVVVAFMQGDDLAQSDRPQRYAMPIVTGGPALDGVVRALWTAYPTSFRLLEGSVDLSFDADGIRAVMGDQAKRLASGFEGEERARYEAIDPGYRQRFLDGDLNPYIMMLAVREPDRFLPSARFDDPTTQRHVGNVAAALRRIRAAADGTPLLVFSIPSTPYASEVDHATAVRLGFTLDPRMLTGDDADRAVEQAARDAGLPAVAFTREFRDEVRIRPLYFPVDGHFNADGHAFYAGLVAPLVEAALAGEP